MARTDKQNRAISDELRGKVERRIEDFDADERRISLFNCGIDPKSIDWVVNRLRSVKGLTSLDLRDNQIGDHGAIAIAESLNNLTTLLIESNSVGDAGAEAIARGLPSLEALNIADNAVGSIGATAIAKNLTKLTGLAISGNPIDDSGAVALADYLTSLTWLQIESTSLSESGATAIAEHLTKLTELDVGCNAIGDVGVKAIAKYLPNLVKLAIASCGISNVGIASIAQGLTRLESLEMEHNSVGEAGVVAIANHLTALRFLHLEHNSISDPFVVMELVRKLSSHLKHLVIAENPLQWPDMDEPVPAYAFDTYHPNELVHKLKQNRAYVMGEPSHAMPVVASEKASHTESRRDDSAADDSRSGTLSDCPAPFKSRHHELKEWIVKILRQAGAEGKGASASEIAQNIRDAIERHPELQTKLVVSADISHETVTAACKELAKEKRVFHNDGRNKASKWFAAEHRQS